MEATTVSIKSVSNASGALVSIDKANVSGEYWFDPQLGMVVGFDDSEDYTLKITTRTETSEAEEEDHSKTTEHFLDVE